MSKDDVFEVEGTVEEAPAPSLLPPAPFVPGTAYRVRGDSSTPRPYRNASIPQLSLCAPTPAPVQLPSTARLPARFCSASFAGSICNLPDKLRS